MKIFFDTNVYIAEALLGAVAQRLIHVTRRARWRIFASEYLLDEVSHVLVDDLGFSRRLAALAQERIIYQCSLVKPSSTATVPGDPKDSPILQAALTSRADYLVTNDRHLLTLDPLQNLRVVSMTQYHEILKEHGLLK